MTLEPLAVALVVAVVLVTGGALRPRPAARIPDDSAARHSAAVRSSRILLGGQWIHTTIARHRSRQVIRPAGVASWCDDVARRVRSGTSLGQALVQSVPGDADVRDATAAIRLGIERGRPVADAVSDVEPARRGSRHLATACSVIAVSAALGGASAAPLDRAAAALRLRAVDDEERRSHSAQARLSAHVLTVLPIGMLVLLVTTDPDVRQAVVEPVGVLCVAIGVALNATGWLWMRHTIGRRP